MGKKNLLKKGGIVVIKFTNPICESGCDDFLNEYILRITNDMLACSFKKSIKSGRLEIREANLPEKHFWFEMHNSTDRKVVTMKEYSNWMRFLSKELNKLIV